MPKRQYGLYGKYGLYVPTFNKDLLNYLNYMDNMHYERARVFGTVIFGQYRILSPLFLLLI